MKLRIDSREKHLIEKFKDISENYLEYCNLDLGDIQICDSSNNIILIFERKSISDLLSSIKDGRYTEQSLRLSENNMHNHYIYYIIEGQIRQTNENLVYSTICSLSYFKGFSILRTNNILDTFKLILQFFKKVQKDKREGYYNKETNDVKDYCSVIKSKKKDNINPENILKIILMQIPNISDKTATAIFNKYETLNNLLEIIEKNQKELYEIKIENNKTCKSRKISKNSITNIINFLGK